ncbi:ABC transporter permease [Chitinophaga sp. 22321]|uniref:ABC transporter permease n=1 Tax=Chitinophaga hostae TaxID=2831022 RepID=A0ABS5J857_9BACT|nr:ABC transporter permease [Chitinophaga hostae]MBS0030597.1 ABC transporter permease [Chitinophaga hostae]
MLNNYFKLSYRTLWRKKSFSLLNILGLAVGIGATLLIFLVIRNEMSYDTYQHNRNRIFRVVTTIHSRSNGEVLWTHGMVPAPLAPALRQDFPALEKVAVVEYIGGAQIYVPGKGIADEKKFKESTGLFFAEPAVFDLFDFTWLDGNAAALKEPNTAVLTQSLAEAYFGNYKDAIGKTIQLWSFRVPLRVVGVYKDLPANTDLPVRMAASYVTWLRRESNAGLINEWRSLSGGTQCFVLTSPQQNIAQLQGRLPAFVKNHFREDADHTTGVRALAFQPLKDMHLDKRFPTLKDDSLSPAELWALTIIGIFLLLVACINFINLATAQSVNRAREIGIRKVLGSNRLQLLKQFLNETALITALALVLGCMMAWVALPYLSDLIQKPLALAPLQYPSILLFLLLTGIAVTFLAGFYPAIVLSGFNPLAAIKSRINARSAKGISLRRGLVVFQFVVAQLLVIGTLVVVKQMQFFRNQPMGFEKKAVVLLDLPSDSTLKLKYPYLKSRLLQLPGVVAGSLCSVEPSSRSGRFTDYYYNNERQPYSVKRVAADTGYFNTFRLGLVAGRYPFPSDTMREVLVNETIIKKLGLHSPADIVGKMIAVDEGGLKSYPVTGVLRDYNNNSLRDEIAPSLISTGYDDYGTLALRLNPESIGSTLKQIEKVFTEVYPTYIYDCTFFDAQIGNFYKAEAMTAALFKVFAFLAMFISCLGLYGLVSFMAVQKTKEVGIRKVLGASVQSIVFLFSKEFTILISIAFVVAAPVGYYFMKKWLFSFHYHTDMGWGIFILAIGLSVLIAWIAVGYKAVRAALVNPVKSLSCD